jgi:hypothetical protein
MADVFKLFTQGCMEKATVTATDASTNFPITNAVNGELDTWWKPLNATGNKDILIDLGTAQAISGSHLRIRNFFGDGIYLTMTITLAYSSDGITYTDVTAITANTSQDGDILFDFASVSRRYWRFRFSSLSASLPQVAMAAVCKKWAITHPGEPPRRNPRRFYTDKNTDPSGRSISSLMNRRAQKSFVRSFNIVNSAHYDSLMSAFEDSQSSVLPVILQEDNGIPYVVKIADDVASWPEYYLGLWQVQMTFDELPFITFGELY